MKSLTILAMAAAIVAGTQPARGASDLNAYRGNGAWVDIYDKRQLNDPAAVVDSMASAGARTLFIETANYHLPAHGSFANWLATAAIIDAAHARGISVVAWYLPSFVGLRRDLQRSLDAIRFTTLSGGRFDSFALDIEANVVRSIAQRNRNAIRLSRRIRAGAGAAYPLGAIVPDRRSTERGRPSLWPRFPYRRLRALYDVYLPMSYSSARGRGAAFVYGYTLDNVGFLRASTGDAALPVHVIGGLANRLGSREASAFAGAASDSATIGRSFYKLSLSGPEDWRALQLPPGAALSRRVEP